MFIHCFTAILQGLCFWVDEPSYFPKEEEIFDEIRISEKPSSVFLIKLHAFSIPNLTLDEQVRMGKNFNRTRKVCFVPSQTAGSSSAAVDRSFIRGYAAFSSSWFCAHKSNFNKLGSFGSVNQLPNTSKCSDNLNLKDAKVQTQPSQLIKQ